MNNGRKVQGVVIFEKCCIVEVKEVNNTAVKVHAVAKQMIAGQEFFTPVYFGANKTDFPVKPESGMFFNISGYFDVFNNGVFLYSPHIEVVDNNVNTGLYSSGFTVLYPNSTVNKMDANKDFGYLVYEHNLLATTLVMQTQNNETVSIEGSFYDYKEEPVNNNPNPVGNMPNQGYGGQVYNEQPQAAANQGGMGSNNQNHMNNHNQAYPNNQGNQVMGNGYDGVNYSANSGQAQASPNGMNNYPSQGQVPNQGQVPMNNGANNNPSYNQNNPMNNNNQAGPGNQVSQAPIQEDKDVEDFKKIVLTEEKVIKLIDKTGIFDN